MSTRRSPLEGLIRFCLERKPVVALMTLLLVGWGLLVSPFDWRLEERLGGLPRDPIPVDALPDLGENQQIVFTEWRGRSPQDVEDQVTYPLTAAMLGVPGVRTIRSNSVFGFSTLYVIFEESRDFYESRSRLLEKLASLPPDLLPAEVSPSLGPDATPLGQVFWYTLEGRDPGGAPAGGWDLGELRAIQDWQLRFELASVDGVAEVASVGGFVPEYQIDVDPDAMRGFGVSLHQVYDAIRRSNTDVGARTIEVNQVEYFVRSRGFLTSLEDIEQTVIRVREGVPVRVVDVAHVSRGPAQRRGALDKGGAEAVGGVVVARYGANPLQVIEGVREKIAELGPALPAKAIIDWALTDRDEVERWAERQGLPAPTAGRIDQDAWVPALLGALAAGSDRPQWLTLSRVSVVPFYDRTGLIQETLGTLDQAVRLEVLVTICVVLLMVLHLRAALILSASLPLAILGAFVAMKVFSVDANIVALSGIAIAIGTMVDMGIVLIENVLRHLDEAPPEADRLELVLRASTEVGGAILTSVATTVVGFLPVFTMIGAEGKLFRPLAFTKTFALVAAIVLALTVLPAAIHALVARGRARRSEPSSRPAGTSRARIAGSWISAAAVLTLLVSEWRPLGGGVSYALNLLFGGAGLLLVLLVFLAVRRFYERILTWGLAYKALFLGSAGAMVFAGALTWLGFGRLFAPIAALAEGTLGAGQRVRETRLWSSGEKHFPGLSKEFMPPLDEGSYLFMPSTMPHASIGEALDVLALQDRRIGAIPEVDLVVGKIGRATSALDPAPVSMVETVVTYLPEYGLDDEGQRVRQWRDHVREPDDIWREIVAAGSVPGSTTATRLQPIATRLVMQQTGMRAPMGVKVRGSRLEDIEAAGLAIESLLREAPGVEPSSVLADRVVGKPYLEIDWDRRALARHGLVIGDVQDVVEVAVGGRQVTRTVEGRERYPVRVRYARELRDSIEDLERILVPTASGAQIPLSGLGRVEYVRGPQMIRSEDGRLVSYVIFDKLPGLAEVDVVEDCRRFLDQRVAAGELVLPPGTSFSFSGTYEAQVRSQKTLKVVLPLALLLIFLLLYLQFRSTSTAAMVFSGVFVAWSGGFLALWLYGQPWFLDFAVFGRDLREVFRVQPVNLSVAVWVGFLALFGIATDDGVVMATYLDQSFERSRPRSLAAIRAATLEAGKRRVRPCLMTTATTLLALMPVLTSRGRGSDILVPMAIPTVGGMTLAVLTMFVVPMLYCAREERRLRRSLNRG